jgi:carboxyl-terminal processing protease
MRAVKILVIVLVVALGFLGGYFIGWYLHGENTVRLSPGQITEANKAGDLTERVVQELQGRYYLPVDVTKLSTAGIDGMLKSLDDTYTVYWTPAEAKAYQEKVTGQYYGIGAALAKDKGGLVITAVFAGSPAKAAGLKPGDAIVTVDGKPTRDEAIDVSIARIKGDEGTHVLLGVRPKGGGAVKQYNLVRRRIDIPETRSRIEVSNGQKVGYVQLWEFGGLAARDVREEVQKLTKKGARSFILDLRYNTGGLFKQAIDVTGVFQTGVVVTTQGLHWPKEVSVTHGPVATDKRMVVLVNGWSASSSEIVTGALQDHRRAEVVGTQTFGKGLVQDVVPLGNGGALKLTAAVYLTPDGTDINHKGITPDIVVKDDLKTKKDEQLQAALAYLTGKK